MNIIIIIPIELLLRRLPPPWLIDSCQYFVIWPLYSNYPQPRVFGQFFSSLSFSENCLVKNLKILKTTNTSKSDYWSYYQKSSFLLDLKTEIKHLIFYAHIGFICLIWNIEKYHFWPNLGRFFVTYLAAARTFLVIFSYLLLR